MKRFFKLNFKFKSVAKGLLFYKKKYSPITSSPNSISTNSHPISGFHCTLGEEVHLEKKIFENQFFKYQKITKNILTVEKKFQKFSEKNDQHLLGANFFLQNWQGYIFGKV